MKPIVFLLLFLGLAPLSFAQSPTALEAKASVQAVLDAYLPESSQQVDFSFTHKRHRFGDFYHPWQTDTQSLAGSFGIIHQEDPMFYLEDYFTDAINADTQLLFYQSIRNELWTQDSAIRDLGNLASDFYLFRTIKFTPYFALRLFQDSVKAQFVSYRQGPVDTLWFEYLACPIKIYWDSHSLEVQKIQFSWPDLSYGDRSFEVQYYGHLRLHGAQYPLQTATIERGIIKDRIQIRPKLPQTNRFLQWEQIQQGLPTHEHSFPSGETRVTKYNDFIYFIDMGITGTRSMVVSFEDYFLVVGAPLQTNYGELIYMKIKEIHPAKFVRYFVPGHHHLLFQGGIRGFVRRGSTVLAPQGSTSFIKDLVHAPHTIWKDLLTIQPAPLILDSFENEITIKDDKLTLKIIDMGPASGMAEHYLLFYFPEFGFLYQQDLARIPAKEGGYAGWSPGNQALKDFILKKQLQVNVIAQGYPIDDPDWKTLFFLGELMKAP